MSQSADEEVQDRRVGGGRSRAEQERIRATVEQRPGAGAGQVRNRLVPPPPVPPTTTRHTTHTHHINALLHRM